MAEVRDGGPRQEGPSVTSGAPSLHLMGVERVRHTATPERMQDMRTSRRASSTGGQTSFRMLLALLVTVTLTAPLATSAQQRGCFVGVDQLGQPAGVILQVERFGDWFEISGQIHSTGTGQTYQFKADGHSGAGRLYSRHEYEAGAVYIQVLELTETDFILEVEGYGVFRFQRRPC